MNNPLHKSEDHCEICKLQSLLKNMTLPSGRLDDFKWLNRNLGIQNSKHPNYTEARELLTKIMKELEYDY